MTTIPIKKLDKKRELLFHERLNTILKDKDKLKELKELEDTIRSEILYRYDNLKNAEDSADTVIHLLHLFLNIK